MSELTLKMSVTVTTYTADQFKKDCEERNAWFLKVNGREINYEDVIKSWGGRMSGESQLTQERINSRSENDGVINQTL